MNYAEPADLAGPDDPDNAHVFETELDTNAEQLATPHAATMEQVHKSEAVGALVRRRPVCGLLPRGKHPQQLGSVCQRRRTCGHYRAKWGG